MALRRIPLKALALSGAALSVLLAPTGASAQCKDTTGLVLAAGLPIPTIYPLGVGNSLNALLSTINTVNTAFLTNTASFVSAPGGAAANQQTGGVWGRTVAGYVETKTSSANDYFLAAGAVNGKGTCVGTTRQEYVGSQFGFDLGTLDLGGGGANLHFGITGGFFGSKSKDLTGPGIDPAVAIYTLPSGKLTVDSEVLFAGLYAVLTQGGFFTDTQLRFDLYKNTLTDASNGLSAAALDARGISVTANAGYNLKLPSDWFIEPSIGGVWSRVAVDDFAGPGVNALRPGFPPLLLGQGPVTFDNIESLLGRASLRVGTTVTNGNYVWQPFATASLLREFASAAKARTEVAGGFNAGSTLDMSAERVGTYAQFGLGTGVVFGNSGWLGYGRVDYKTGDSVEGVNFNIGLRHQW